jgi:hypothetical protein
MSRSTLRIVLLDVERCFAGLIFYTAHAGQCASVCICSGGVTRRVLRGSRTSARASRGRLRAIMPAAESTPLVRGGASSPRPSARAFALAAFLALAATASLVATLGRVVLASGAPAALVPATRLGGGRTHETCEDVRIIGASFISERTQSRIDNEGAWWLKYPLGEEVEGHQRALQPPRAQFPPLRRVVHARRVAEGTAPAGVLPRAHALPQAPREARPGHGPGGDVQGTSAARESHRPRPRGFLRSSLRGDVRRLDGPARFKKVPPRAPAVFFPVADETKLPLSSDDAALTPPPFRPSTRRPRSP